MIDLAIDDEEHDECGEDWTSRLGINLRHCVKIRKTSPSKQVQHALKLGGLFAENIQSTDLSTIKWQSRRSRSKKNNYPTHCKPCEKTRIRNNDKPCASTEMKKDKAVGVHSGDTVKKEVKLIQYSRKKFKTKPSVSTGAAGVCRIPATNEGLYKHSRVAGENKLCNIGCLSSNASEKQPEDQMFEATRDQCLGIKGGSIEAQIDNINFKKEMNMDGKSCCLTPLESSAMLDKTGDGKESSENKYASPFVQDLGESFGIHREKQILGQLSMIDSACNLASEGKLKIQADGDVLTNEIPLKSSQVVDSLEGASEGGCDEVSEHMILNNVMRQELNITNRNSDKEPLPCNSSLVDPPVYVSREECYEDPSKMPAIKPEQGLNSTVGRDDEPYANHVRAVNEPTTTSIKETSKIPTEICATAELCQCPTSEGEHQLNIPTAVRDNEENDMNFLRQMQMEATPCGTEKEHPQVLRGGSGQEDLVDVMRSGTEFHEELMSKTRQMEPISNLVIEPENRSMCVSVEEFEDPSTYSKDDLNGDMTSDGEQRKGHTVTDNSEEEMVLPTPISNEKHSRIERETLDTEGLCYGSEVCSSNARRERKRKREMEQTRENTFGCSGFIRGPCEGLRPRNGKDATSGSGIVIHEDVKEKLPTKVKKPSGAPVAVRDKKEKLRKPHKCDLEGCRMSFDTKAELRLHKRNRCPHEGCGKRFSSHKYAMIHHRVHDEERPLKCPWKGCSMSFKWAWARTEHIRVHTGERPYKCKVEGCGLSFRFVSDFSRHRRKTGHYVN